MRFPKWICQMNMPLKSFCVVFCLWLVALLNATPASAEVSCKDWNKYGYSFFSEATAADVSRCIKAGADVNERDEYGETPLHEAGYYTKNPAVITALVEAGAEVNARDKWGDTPLHNAARNTKTRGSSRHS